MTELSHHGIKGMKWGVRKAESSGSSGRPHLPSLTPQQKKVAIATTAALVGTGATIAAGILAGPTAGMSIAAISRAAQYAANNAFGVKTSGYDSSFNTPNSGHMDWVRDSQGNWVSNFK